MAFRLFLSVYAEAVSLAKEMDIEENNPNHVNSR